MPDGELRQTLLDLLAGYRRLARVAEQAAELTLAATYDEIADLYEAKLTALDAGSDPLTVISLGRLRLVS
jgi:hypothetical protein